jgi:putative transposase
VLSEHGVKIAPSTYYARAKHRVTDAELAEAYLANALVDLHRANWGVYGIRKLWHAAGRAGLPVGRDQVARLMRIAGITGAVRGRRRTITTRRDSSRPRHPDLVKRGWDGPTEPDQLSVADFSNVWTLARFCYVAFVVDVYSRRILGWRVSTSKEATLVVDAFRQALQVRHPGDATWTATGLVITPTPGPRADSTGRRNTLIAEVLDGTAEEAGAAGAGGRVGSGLRIGRCGRRCARRAGPSRRELCNGSSGA